MHIVTFGGRILTPGLYYDYMIYIDPGTKEVTLRLAEDLLVPGSAGTFVHVLYFPDMHFPGLNSPERQVFQVNGDLELERVPDEDVPDHVVSEDEESSE